MHRLLVMFFVLVFSLPEFVLANTDGISATASTRGKGTMVVGSNPYNFHSTRLIEGTINISVQEMGDRWSHLQNIDKINVTSEFISGNTHYKIIMNKAMARHPYEKYPTFFGVAYNEEMNGDTFIGTSQLPKLTPDVALWGWAKVVRDNKVIATMVPAHVKVMTSSPLKGIMLEIDTENQFLHEVEYGYFNIYWNHIDSLTPPTNHEKKRERFAWMFLVVLDIGLFWLVLREKQTNT
ncbi:hypothetical protein J7E71_12580 [Mesobacillus foraminis]|uniref:hypothetical protein n=1 Tax=Mesobacillus foraminis TaxID=279826 RepID=UPI001BEB2FF9|nr:hypothetical protein [Mesobacillus foraminis]MBT2756791.1 hypothetical protein [Mesobacillus foraminis]